jgi:hypothetical protein
VSEVPSVEWWAEVDRSALREACASLCRTGGLLVISGDGMSGRQEASVLARHALAQDGRPLLYVAAPSSGVALTRHVIRTLLAEAESVRRRTPGAIGVGAATVGASDRLLGDLFVEVAQPLADGPQGLAVVIAGLGVETRPHDGDLRLLRSLADRTGGAWVITGSNDASWDAAEPDSHLTLGKFERWEVAAVLRLAERDQVLTRQASDRVMASLFSQRQRTVAAATAYAALQGAKW